jgi:methylphosphotriester-DNA--protein-cysteine methyltransferase
VAHRARDYLYAHIGDNIGLSDLARETGTDRFTLTRCFKREFNLAPHAWLIQLRLAKARQCWRAVTSPLMSPRLWALPTKATWALVQRAYRISPAHYRRLCTNLPDVSRK